MQWFMMIWTLL